MAYAFQLHGSSASILFMGRSAICASTSVRYAWGLTWFILAVYAARRPMPNGSRKIPYGRAVTGRRADIRPSPFGIVCHLQRVKEGEQAVVRPEAGSLATLVRLELHQGCFLECEVGV